MAPITSLIVRLNKNLIFCIYRGTLFDGLAIGFTTSSGVIHCYGCNNRYFLSKSHSQVDIGTMSLSLTPNIETGALFKQ